MLFINFFYSSFRRHLEPQIKEEIIGDVYVTFNFNIPKKVEITGHPRKVVLESNSRHSIPNTPQKTSIQVTNNNANKGKY